MPAESGTARSIDARSSASGLARKSLGVNWVRTAIMPQPMSTPTAAGMIAPNVGITDPTVAPLPRCASGIRARCGKINGICDAVRACSSVLGSMIDAHEINRFDSCRGPRFVTVTGLIILGRSEIASGFHCSR